MRAQSGAISGPYLSPSDWIADERMGWSAIASPLCIEVKHPWAINPLWVKDLSQFRANAEF